MKILALETTTTRGSVALVEDREVRAVLEHAEPNRHAERMLPLVAEALALAGWGPQSIDRVAVGVGPGAFTGIRVGISLALGLSLGLGAEALGVGSLRIVAVGHPASDPRLRVVLRDARREEYFLAAYAPNGDEVLAPLPVPRGAVAREIGRRFGGGAFVLLGDRLADLPGEPAASAPTPAAVALGLLAERLDPQTHPVTPAYVRGPGAEPPDLPPSPLLLPRR